ncbi:hypothetical protein [Actinomadura rugatobispora]|uniref:Uncharacterized protein n=1 Tax=Actinomadura rugatobispora TaxID=1994 RepID=A0ABW1A628_9ACTN
MKMLPRHGGTPVLRTDFSGQGAWDAVRVAIRTPNEDGIFRGF